ncbi:hypothetical protein EMIT019CA3_40197 [Bacillus pseudomycoides]
MICETASKLIFKTIEYMNLISIHITHPQLAGAFLYGWIVIIYS